MPHRVVEVKPRPRDRVRVTLSGGRFFTVPVEQAAGVEIGCRLADEDVARLDRVDQFLRGRDKAMVLIARRERSRHEVDTALTGLGIEPAVRAGLLSELTELGLVDDRRFAREFVRARAETRFLGPHRLRFELRRRGVSRQNIDAAVFEVFGGETSQVDQARSLVERKTRGLVIDERVARRMSALLKRRGYDYGIVNEVTIELLRRAGRELPSDE